nr:hypothetical protein [Lachnospiraceae bacterium]
MLVVAIILSVIVGVCFAYGIMASQVCKSNNYGDSMGEIADFAQGTWNVVEQRNYKTKKKNWTNDKLMMESQARILRGT